MPMKGPRVCNCGKLVAAGIVCECQRERKASYDANRPTARQRGYDAKWQRAAKSFLARHPYCACGCGRLADCVDHITPHRGDMKLFWDKSNWQALASSPCHSSRKQALECA